MLKLKTVSGCDAHAPRPAALRRAGPGGRDPRGIWPPKVRAAEIGSKVNPRNNARNVIFYEISGAISHLDTFDFKDNPAVPKDFQVRKISTGIYFPVNFLPRIEKIMDRVAMVRSFVTHEEVHLRGQYYVQAGRQLNVAFAREIPSIGTRGCVRVGIAPADVRHLSDVRIVQSGDQPGGRALHGIPAAAILGIRSECRAGPDRDDARPEGQRVDRGALARACSACARSIATA